MIALLDAKAEKFVRLGLDRAASEGEVSTSGAMLFRHLRSQGVTADALLGTAAPHEDFHIWFGKYNGRPISKVPGDYLRWVLSKIEDLPREFRRAVEQELATR